MKSKSVSTCPYCDIYGKGVVIKTTMAVPYEDYRLKAFYVKCIQCKARGPKSNSLDSAVDDWNRIAKIVGNNLGHCTDEQQQNLVNVDCAANIGC